MKISRLDVYRGMYIDEAIEMIDSWGNRSRYKNNSKKQHLINNMQGWLAEEIFKETYPEWNYINKEEHMYIHEHTGWWNRTGAPDFETVHNGVRLTCEVKTYATKELLEKKIQDWQKNDKELHSADYVYILIGRYWYALDQNDWTYHKMEKAELPVWYEGKFIV